MDNIYIDFTHSLPIKGAKYHGGGNYTKRLLNLISQVPNLKKNVIVLWPKGYSANSKEEESIRNSDKLLIQEVEQVNENVDFRDKSVLFFPLLNLRDWKIAKIIKKKYPNIKIYITIHGLRLLDLKADKYDSFYYNKKGFKFYAPIEHLIKSVLYKKIVKDSLPYFDKIFTVSNYSLQQIVKMGNVNFINHYYQGIILENRPIKIKIKNDYILFVGANRAEKNFIRALEAFCNYKKRKQNEVFLYVTGVDENMKNKIFRNYDSEIKKIMNSWVKFFDYVETDYLNDLYKQCIFFLYTSKSEGFGLPVMEAILNRRPVVASYITSIPEVAGSAVYYVNPYNVESIEKGIAYMSDPVNLNRYEKMVQKRVLNMKERVEIDQEAFIEEILK